LFIWLTWGCGGFRWLVLAHCIKYDQKPDYPGDGPGENFCFLWNFGTASRACRCLIAYFLAARFTDKKRHCGFPFGNHK
jgi:hypothetical protein